MHISENEYKEEKLRKRTEMCVSQLHWKLNID